MRKQGFFSLYLSSLTFPTTPVLLSQSKSVGDAPQFDHFAIYIHDLGKSAASYEKVMELQQNPCPLKMAA